MNKAKSKRKEPSFNSSAALKEVRRNFTTDGNRMYNKIIYINDVSIFSKLFKILKEH